MFDLTDVQLEKRFLKKVNGVDVHLLTIFPRMFGKAMSNFY